MNWINVKHKLPEELETVWAFNINTKFIALASLFYSDGWMWAISNGTIYIEDQRIVSECEHDDEYVFTHWMRLPDLPVK